MSQNNLKQRFSFYTLPTFVDRKRNVYLDCTFSRDIVSSNVNEVTTSFKLLFFLQQYFTSTKKHQKALKSIKTTNLRFINLKFIDTRFINLRFIEIRFINLRFMMLKKHLSGKKQLIRLFVKKKSLRWKC